MEKLAGHEKARTVGGKRVTAISGDYPAQLGKEETESPWESFNPNSQAPWDEQFLIVILKSLE